MHLSNFQWICTSRQNHEALKSKMRLNAEYAHYGLIFTDICIHYYFTGYLHQNTDALQKTAPLLGCWGKSTYNGCDATCNRVSTILEHQQAMAVESSPIWPIPNPTQIYISCSFPDETWGIVSWTSNQVTGTQNLHKLGQYLNPG